MKIDTNFIKNIVEEQIPIHKFLNLKQTNNCLIKAAKQLAPRVTQQQQPIRL